MPGIKRAAPAHLTLTALVQHVACMHMAQMKAESTQLSHALSMLTTPLVCRHDEQQEPSVVNQVTKFGAAGLTIAAGI